MRKFSNKQRASRKKFYLPCPLGDSCSILFHSFIHSTRSKVLLNQTQTSDFGFQNSDSFFTSEFKNFAPRANAENQTFTSYQDGFSERTNPRETSKWDRAAGSKRLVPTSRNMHDNKSSRYAASIAVYPSLLVDLFESWQTASSANFCISSWGFGKL